MTRKTRPISWVKQALKEFLKFPEKVQQQGRMTLTIIAEGQSPDNTKPLKGIATGVREIVLKDSSGTYRVIYALKIDDDIWVFHAFKKKSKTEIKTPKQEIDTLKTRLKDLKELLK